MMKFLRRTRMLVAALLLATTFVYSVTNIAYAQSDDAKTAVCSGVGLTGSSCGVNQASTSVSTIIKFAINMLSLIAGIAAVIMIIIAGFRFITSGGDSSGVSSAKNTLIYALVGIVVVALSQIIVHFVLDRV